jgi:hypothetical protein
MEPEERAAAGLFLAFQYPVEIPGVGNMTFLRTAVNAQRKARGEEELSAADFLKLVREKAKTLKIDAEMLKRPVNVGFSGGEKKRNEILQMAMLEPKHVHHGRDRFRPGRRCDAAGGRGRERAARARSQLPGHHPLPAPAGPYPAPMSSTSWPMAASSRPAARNWRWRSKRTAMPIFWRRSADGGYGCSGCQRETRGWRRARCGAGAAAGDALDLPAGGFTARGPRKARRRG